VCAGGKMGQKGQIKAEDYNFSMEREMKIINFTCL